MIRSFGFLLSGNACAAAILLLRTVVVSRLISLEDFGIGTSLVLALAMIEMLTALGFQQQIVNAPKGDDADFHSALHGVALIRGMIGAAALFMQFDRDGDGVIVQPITVHSSDPPGVFLQQPETA